MPFFSTERDPDELPGPWPLGPLLVVVLGLALFVFLAFHYARGVGAAGLTHDQTGTATLLAWLTVVTTGALTAWHRRRALRAARP